MVYFDQRFMNHLSLFWCTVYKPRNVHFKKVKNLSNQKLKLRQEKTNSLLKHKTGQNVAKSALPRRKFTTGGAPRQHCQRTSSAGIVLAVDHHEVCRGAGKASKGNTDIVLTSSAALALTFSAGVVLAELRQLTTSQC